MNAESSPAPGAGGTILAPAPDGETRSQPVAAPQTLAEVIRGTDPGTPPEPKRATQRRHSMRRAAAAPTPGSWWRATPTHLTLARRIEPSLAASLALTATLATPAAAHLLGTALGGTVLTSDALVSGSGVDIAAGLIRTWSPTLVALGIAGLSLTRRTTVGALVARGVALLATAAALASLNQAATPVALLWIVAVAASYPFLLPRSAGRALVTVAMMAMAVPLLTQAARSGAADPAGSLIGQVDPTAVATTLTLLGGMAVIASLGSAAAATRSTLRATAHLAIRRTRDAEQAGAALDRATAEDELTGLPNRSTLTRQTILALAEADVTGGQVGLLMISLDRSAAIRDGIGTEADDEVIRQVGRRIRAARPAAELVARCGEHRFAVLIPGIGPEGGAQAARRLAALIEEPVSTDERTIAVSGSIGIAVSAAGLDTADDLIRAAEEAMRAAEKGGRSPWAMFDRAMRAHSESQASLEAQLREAIRTGRIEAAFQAIVPAALKDGVTDRPVAVEALARWTRPDGSSVSPQRFLPMAEALGLGGQLGLIVLDHALEAYDSWRAAGLSGVQVCVNVSSAQLLDPEFAHQVSARMGSRGIPPAHLMIEISASSYRDGEQARSTLGMLRSLGVELALDDFGRDGTSLATLRQLPLTTVKLDHRLSLDLGRNDVVIRAVVAMCRELGLRTVAEGIETRLQLEAAQRAGLDAVQGFLIAVPGRADQVMRGLASR